MSEWLWILMCLFGSIGIAQCIEWAVGLRRRPRGMRWGYRVITLYDQPDQLEAQLRYDLSRFGQNVYDGVVLLVDMGLSEESAAICDRFICKNPGMMRCEADRLTAVIRDLDALQDG